MGIANSFDQYPRDWYQWYTSSEPENTPLPGEVFILKCSNYKMYPISIPYRRMAEFL